MKIIIIFIVVVILANCRKETSCYVCTVNCNVGHPNYDTTICNGNLNDPIQDGYGNTCAPLRCIKK